MTTTQPDIPSTPNPSTRNTGLFRFNSIGIRLFLAILGGATIGLGTLGFFSYQRSEKQDKVLINAALEREVKELDGQLKKGESFIQTMGTSASFLADSKASSAEDYRRFIITQMAARPSLVSGFGILQTPNGLVQGKQWFAPYIVENTAQTMELVKKGLAEQLPAPHQKFAYEDLTLGDEYFKQDYYLDALKSNKVFWSEPYITEGFSVALATYAGPIKNQAGQVVGIFNGDISLKDLVSEIQRKTVVRETGYFALVSSQGNVLAYPSKQKTTTNKETDLVNVTKVPTLKAAWGRVQQAATKQPAGIIKIDETSGYWAYRRIPSTNWIMLATVPYDTVSGAALQNAVGGILIVAIILAGVVTLFVQYLNRRLKPILDECNKLAAMDVETQMLLDQQDEIGQLSTSFFNLIDQLHQNEEKIRQEAAMRVSLEEEQRQTSEAESATLQADIGVLLDVVSAVEEGNLAVQAPVNDRVTGLVSDTFNRLLEELNRVMATVTTTAQQVTNSATDLGQLATQSSQQTKQQTEAVVQVDSLVQDVTRLIQDNAQQSTEATLAVQKAQAAVNQGQQQMNTLNAEISHLQEGADQITRRVQTLTDFVQLAAQFVKTQQRTASMTRVLALNASLLSSRATEQQDPAQFASISREFETITTQVNELASQTNQDLIVLQQRTDQIQTVVSGLSQDVSEINQTVKAFTQGVDSSTEVFSNIQDVTDKVAQVGQRIAASSQSITQASQTTLASVQDIAALVMATERGADLTREQSIAMEQLSRDLLELMSFFQIAPQFMNQVLPLQPAQDLETQSLASLA
jgi:methyl-accepting chemotaxis protein PixJ